MRHHLSEASRLQVRMQCKLDRQKWAKTVLPNPGSYCSRMQTGRSQKPPKLHHKSMPSLAVVKKGKKHDRVCILREGRSHASPPPFLLFSHMKGLLARAKPQFFVPRLLPQSNTDPKQECSMLTSEITLSWNGYTYHHPLLSHFVSALIALIKTALRKKQQLGIRYFTRFRSFCSVPHNVSGGN